MAGIYVTMDIKDARRRTAGRVGNAATALKRSTNRRNRRAARQAVQAGVDFVPRLGTGWDVD